MNRSATRAMAGSMAGSTARPVARAMAVVGSIALVSLATACSGDDDGTDGRPALDLGDSGPGTCLAFPDDVGEEVTTLPVVDCSVPHSHEIYAVEIAGDTGAVYPGFDALEELAQLRCLAAFEPFVGSNPFDSRLFHSWLVPTLDSWNDEGDREIICVLGEPDSAPMSASMRDSGV